MTGAQFEISIDGVPRTYRDQKGRFAGRADPEVQKSQQCRRLKDLKTGAEITIAFKAANNNGMLTLPNRTARRTGSSSRIPRRPQLGVRPKRIGDDELQWRTALLQGPL